MRAAVFIVRYWETTFAVVLFLGAVYGAVFCAIAQRYAMAAYLLVVAVGLFDVLCVFLNSDEWRSVLRRRAQLEELDG